MTPKQFQRLSFALIGLFEEVPLEEALREALERAKLAPEDVWSEDGLIHNVIDALRWAETSIAESARTEPKVRAAIFAAAMNIQMNRRMAPMNEARQETSAANRKRARELRAEGLSAARIAVQMTSERNREDLPDITVRAVERWLAVKKVPTR
jgi:hypothetical protein